MPIPAALAAWGGPTAFTALGYLVNYLFPGENKVWLMGQCNVFEGRWVFDPHYHPLYTPQTCPFIPGSLDCQSNGRPDTDYIKYRWKPYSCRLPRFHGKSFLKRFQGKRIMVVGDSVGYSQWLSLACLLYSAISQPKYALHTKGGLSTLTFPDYNVSVMFSRNDFLVDIADGDKNERVLRVDAIGNGGPVWKDADVLVFNSWNEWLQTGKKQPWDVIQEANTWHKDMDPLVAYQKALKTWANWVNSTVDTNKTKIFFQGVSPDHFNSRDWADPNAKNCKRQTRPVPGHRYPGGQHPAQAVLAEALGKVSKSVQFVNVITLSQLRKDGHPSIYGSKDVDCTHWCLPGLPDACNELLYASLLGY